MKSYVRRVVCGLSLVAPLGFLCILWFHSTRIAGPAQASDDARPSVQGLVQPAVSIPQADRFVADAGREIPLADDETRMLIRQQLDRDARAQAGAGDVLPTDFLQRAVRGNAVGFELPDGSTAHGSANVVERDDHGILAVHGRLTAPGPGTFLLQRQTAAGVAGPFVGHVWFDEGAAGWKIERTDDLASARFVPRHVDEILCVNLSAPPLETAEGSDEQIDPQYAPQTHPTTIPIPHYQPIIPLQSLPGATGVIYLDFDGEKGPFPGWGSFDATPSSATNTQIYEVWRRVCEDFQGFNLNITTDRKVFDNAPPGRRQQVIITPTKDAAPGAGGVAYVGTYNWTTSRPCWAYSQTGKSAAEVISHEIGHTLGLSHDGRTSPSETYYSGHGTDPVGWAPIMGTGYTKNLTQWSKGEYLSANRTQNDLTIIANNNNVGYRSDDSGDTLSNARYLEILSNNSVSNEGIIERTGDIDAFRFQTIGGSINLAVNPVSLGPNLDIHAEIVNAQTLAVVVENNPLNALNATLATSLTAGEYLLRVRGTGRGDPLGDGYTNYGSLGTYLITGTVNGGVKPDRFVVAENSAIDTNVGTVTPRNNHGGAAVVFSISSGNTGDAFAINPSNGALTVANSSVLNFETLSTRWDIPAVVVPFVAITNPENPSLNESIRVVVSVDDVNEAPVIQTPSFTMLERTLPGTRLPALDAADPDRFQKLDFSIISGNENGFFNIDAETGELTVSTLIEVPQTSTLQLIVAATDSASPPLTTTAIANITVVKQSSPHQPGRIVRTFFENITGTTVATLTSNAKFPNNPDSERYLDAFDESNHGDNFGSTVRGFLIAPVTGAYRFHIASDDSSQLLFAANGNPSTASAIASVSGSTDRYQWDKYSSQLSSSFNLTAGQVCYIEARHKEGVTSDHVAVAWTGPLNASLQVIPGLYLAPFYQNYAPRIATATIPVRENALAGQTIGHITPTDASIGETFGGFTIISGDPDGVFDIDPATGRLFLAKADSLDASAPPHVLTIRVTDGGTPALNGTGTITVQATTADTILAPGLVQQLWTGISGSTIANLTGSGSYPYRPTSTRVLAGGFDSGTNFGDNYGSRIRGYVIPPQSGSYTFYLSTDDDGRLLMGTGASASRAATIAQISGWAAPGDWTKFTSQTSAPRSLVAGQKYYIEALHKESGGGDHVQVAWTGPGISTPTIIPASSLEPFDINMPPVFAPIAGPFAAESDMTPGTLIATVSASDPEGEEITYAITAGDPSGAFAIGADGRITLENPAALENATYPLIVVAQDAGIGGIYPLKPATVNVSITASSAPEPLAAPVFSPPGGNHSAPLAITITSPDGADIVYTTDGSDPLLSSTATDATSPASLMLTATGTTTLRARAVSSGMTASPETSAVYQIGDDYETWITKFTGSDLSDPDADFDGDGLSNHVERAFGLDPTNAASANPITVPLDATDGTISFTRRDPQLTGLTYRVWTSGDLAIWTEDTGAVLTPGALVDEIETVAVQLSQNLLDGPNLFVRVSAATETVTP